MQCRTFSHINDKGGKSYKDKKTFDSLKEAILECKVLNAKKQQITKLVSYKCTQCYKYHIGRNGHVLTEKYKAKLNIELDKLFPSRTKRNKKAERKNIANRTGNATDPKLPNGLFKVIGKIDLSKIPKK